MEPLRVSDEKASGRGQNETRGDATSIQETDSAQPTHPQYASRDQRINSFQRWPARLRQRPEEMAECGFYYAVQSQEEVCSESSTLGTLPIGMGSPASTVSANMPCQPGISITSAAEEIDFFIVQSQEEVRSESSTLGTLPIGMGSPASTVFANMPCQPGISITSAAEEIDFIEHQLMVLSRNYIWWMYWYLEVEDILWLKGQYASTRLSPLKIVLDVSTDVPCELMPNFKQRELKRHSFLEVVTLNSGIFDEWTSYIKSSWLSDGKSQVDYEIWYLNWSRDHPYFSNEITVLAIPYGTEPLPPRSYIVQNDYEAPSPPLPAAFGFDMAATMTFSPATEEQPDRIQSQTETDSTEVASREEPNQNAGSGLGQSSEGVNAADIGHIGLTDQEEGYFNNSSSQLLSNAALDGMMSQENDIDTNCTVHQAENSNADAISGIRGLSYREIRQNEDLRQKINCQECKEKRRCVVFLPCRHMLLCWDCAADVEKKCPACKRDIEERITVQFS